MKKTLFPYFEGDKVPERIKHRFNDKIPGKYICPWSGAGYIHCTSKLRNRKNICQTCDINPDIKDELPEKTGRVLFE